MPIITYTMVTKNEGNYYALLENLTPPHSSTSRLWRTQSGMGGPDHSTCLKHGPREFAKNVVKLIREILQEIISKRASPCICKHLLGMVHKMFQRLRP